MARLIEFFTKTGELVLDPFAGVGGTLLGAAIARGPRRAIGIELDPRWAAVYRETVEALLAERDGAGPLLADLGPNDPGGERGFDPSGLELRLGDAGSCCPRWPTESVDFVATDPPYNVQLPMTMAGGPLAEDARQPAHGLRDGLATLARTSPTCPTTRPSSTRWARSSSRSTASSGPAATPC